MDTKKDGAASEGTSSTTGSAIKPPIGVVPETFYKEQRLRDLAGSINRYVQGGFFGGEHSVSIQIWCEELQRRVAEFR